MWNSAGPMRELFALRTQAAPLVSQPDDFDVATTAGPSHASHTGYIIKCSTTHSWHTDPGSYTPNPYTHTGSFSNL